MTLRAVRPYRAGSVGHRFRDALTSDGISIIAEIKRRSPSKGPLDPNADAASLALSYERGGAACLSVLTDEEGFGGSVQDLCDAKEAVSIPILRKDFLRTPQDVYATKAMGADALLLIVADVPVEMLRPLHDLARERGIDVLTEVREEQELELAVEHGAYMIAVNQRKNPRASEFTVDPNTAVRISRVFDQLGPGFTKIAASGIGVSGGTTLRELADAGYDAALIGEALITAPDPGAEIQSLFREAAPKEPIPV